MTLQAIGIVAIVIGIFMEVFLIGSELRLGTAVAAVGIVVFVYGLFQKREQRRRSRSRE